MHWELLPHCNVCSKWISSWGRICNACLVNVYPNISWPYASGELDILVAESSLASILLVIDFWSNFNSHPKLLNIGWNSLYYYYILIKLHQNRNASSIALSMKKKKKLEGERECLACEKVVLVELPSLLSPLWWDARSHGPMVVMVRMTYPRHERRPGKWVSWWLFWGL